MGLDDKMDLKSRTLMIHCLYYFRTQEELLVHLPLQMKGAKKRGRRDTNTDLRNLRFFSGCHFLSTSPLPPHSHARRMDRNFYSLGCRFWRPYLAIISYALRWLATVSCIFQYLHFGGSILPFDFQLVRQ